MWCSHSAMSGAGEVWVSYLELEMALPTELTWLVLSWTAGAITANLMWCTYPFVQSRLAATQSAVKHSRRAESGRMLHSQSSAAGGMHAGSRLQPQPQRLTSQDSQVSLTSRLFKTRGGR